MDQETADRILAEAQETALCPRCNRPVSVHPESGYSMYDFAYSCPFIFNGQGKVHKVPLDRAAKMIVELLGGTLDDVTVHTLADKKELIYWNWMDLVDVPMEKVKAAEKKTGFECTNIAYFQNENDEAGLSLQFERMPPQ